MKEYKVLVGYGRECDINREHHKIIRVTAENKDKAVELVDGYFINGMFDDIEDDYLEDSLYAIQTI